MLFKHDVECQELIMEALKYHLLPERRLAMQSTRTKPRKSTVGVLYAVGGMDCTKGNVILQTATSDKSTGHCLVINALSQPGDSGSVPTTADTNHL